MISVTINGDTREFSGELSAMDMMEELGLPATKVALERNREVVPKSTYGEVTIKDGDKLEIVHFIGGG